MPCSIEGILIPGFVYFAGESDQSDGNFGVYSQLALGAYPVRGTRYHGPVSRMHLQLPYQPEYPFDVCHYEPNALGCVSCYVWRCDYPPSAWAHFHVWDISFPSEWWRGGDYRFVEVVSRAPIGGRSLGLARFSKPLVAVTDRFVGETHAMRIDVTGEDGRRVSAFGFSSYMVQSRFVF